MNSHKVGVHFGKVRTRAQRWRDRDEQRRDSGQNETQCDECHADGNVDDEQDVGGERASDEQTSIVDIVQIATFHLASIDRFKTQNKTKQKLLVVI